MPQILEGNLVSNKQTFGIIVSRFNEFITGKLLEGAIDTLVRSGVNEDGIDVAWVPGSFEVPLACLKMAKTKKYDGIIALGAVIRGATPHFDYVSSELSKGIAQVSLQTEVPIAFGVLTTDSLEQAIERAGTKSGNKGADAARTIIEMANLMSQMS